MLSFPKLNDLMKLTRYSTGRPKFGDVGEDPEGDREDATEDPIPEVLWSSWNTSTFDPSHELCGDWLESSASIPKDGLTLRDGFRLVGREDGSVFCLGSIGVGMYE